MAQRLAEQAFEMCFSHPPADVAAIKGSPKLAALKVLPGRAPVRAKAPVQAPPLAKTAQKTRGT